MCNEKIALGYELYTSGYVNRYHSHPHPHLRNAQDLTDAHSNRMVKLLYLFFPELAHRGTLVAYIVMHDAGESASGDSPFTAKIANPKLKEALDEVEGQRLAQFYGLFQNDLRIDLTQKEENVVKLLDLLESFLFQAIHAPGRMDEEHHLFQNIEKRARELEVYPEVRCMMMHALHRNNAATKGY
ncbi:hypothetical protein KNU84_gp086 [Bacteriophage DSS3_VP1]|uniref:HD domain-containing protein n=1 Tax=Bacteriophage DSS3_VP1 TaxID=2664196 RepID=A0A7S5FQB6_9CAUD|nr:hypothetical protein KNU84_gp086 [Bacteriophage DSS3_VP1]QGH74618.1 hypothetical protein DSS3VP1_00050 [Bacteriophage DSS3_VP1]